MKRVAFLVVAAVASFALSAPVFAYEGPAACASCGCAKGGADCGCQKGGECTCKKDGGEGCGCKKDGEGACKKDGGCGCAKGGEGTAPKAFDAKPAVGTKATCPVMGGEFVVSDETPMSEYEGKWYAFCCGGCKPKFDADPAKFVK